MNADLGLIRTLTFGAHEVIEVNGTYEFNRMTPEQIAVLQNIQDFAKKATASSGIQMDFITDAEAVKLAGEFTPATTRKYAFFDIFVNGCMVQHSGVENIFETSGFELTIPLSGNCNRVTIYFPGLTKTALKNLEFVNASAVTPAKKSKTMICYGDSITQGYDAVYPSFAYTNLLAAELDAEIFNKAIGADIFNPAFAACKDEIKPDLITIAYGTNDWRKGATCESLEKNATGFVQNIIKNYPGTPIIALLPIWRKDMKEIHPTGQLTDAIAILRKVYESFDNVKIIDGMPLVPHLPEFFADGYLHPNDSGFLLYGKNLIKAIALR
ncbi:MAG: hypothetical protein E7042_04050 [Lentisphaerae bacterium]|nr:hypothetical protein [Lentisphaerota bacterium]